VNYRVIKTERTEPVQVNYRVIQRELSLVQVNYWEIQIERTEPGSIELPVDKKRENQTWFK